MPIFSVKYLGGTIISKHNFFRAVTVWYFWGGGGGGEEEHYGSPGQVLMSLFYWCFNHVTAQAYFKTTASWDPWTSQSRPHPQKKRKWWRRKRRLFKKIAAQLNSFLQEYEAKLEERQKAEKLKFRCKIEEKINAFLKDDKSKTLKFPAMDKFQRL